MPPFGNRVPVQVPDHELIRCIGRGSYGEVWLARNCATHSWRAVKIVFRREFKEERPYEREFEGLLKFEPISRSHPSQLAILHVGRDDQAGCFYYVMELADMAPIAKGFEAVSANAREASVSGFRTSHLDLLSEQLLSEPEYVPHTLRSDLESRGTLPSAQCLELAHQLAVALGHLHSHGLVHRDVKPSNIVYVGGMPKLADIGLVTHAGDACSIVGTEGYLPPEGPGTPAADLFSLGRVLYEAATGLDRRQFPQLPPDLHMRPEAEELVEFNEILLRLGAADARDRYESAAALQQEIAVLQAGRSLRKMRGLERRLAWAKRGALLGITVLALVSGAGWWQHNRATATERAKVLAEESARTLRRHLYAADMKTAHLALQERDRRRSGELLAQYEPKPGEEDLRGFEWHYLWQQHEGDPACVFHDRGALVTSLAFAPDGSLLASGDERQRVGLWDGRTGQELLWLTNGTEKVGANELRFSHDGQWLVSAGAEQISVWEVPGSRLVKRLPTTDVTDLLQERGYNAAEFSPDGARLAARDPESPYSVSIWNTRTWVRERLFPGSGDDMWRFLAWTPDGSLLVVAGRERVRIYNVDSGETAADWRERSIIDAMALAPAGDLLALGCFRHNLRIAEVSSGQTRQAMKVEDLIVRAIAFSPDGQHLVFGGTEKSMHLWDWSAAQRIRSWAGHSANCSAVAVHPSGEVIASGSWDKTARLWPTAKSHETDRLAGAYWPVGFSPDSQSLMTYSYEDHLQLWDLATGRLRHTVRLPDDHRTFFHGYPVLSRDAATLVFGRGDGSIELWDLPARTTKASLHAPNGPIEAWALASDASLVGFVAKGRLTLCRTDDSQREIFFSDATGPVSFSPNANILAVASSSHHIRLLDTRTGRDSVSSESHEGILLAMTLSPDNQLLASASIDGRVGLFDATSGRWLGFLTHKHSVRSVAFSPDGRTLATVSADDVLRLWHVATRREMIAIQRPGVFRRPIMFSPDGSVLAAGAGLQGGPSLRIDLFEHASRYWKSAHTSGEPPSVWLWRSAVAPQGILSSGGPVR